MIQFTTPDTTLVLPNVVFDGTEKPWVTITQGTGAGATEIEVDDLDVTTEGTDTVIQFTLTQEQTGALSVGRANLQLNWLTSDG